MSQLSLVAERPNGQLLKWVGNKYRYAYDIVEHFPSKFDKFIEPFVGTGAIVGTVSPKNGIAGDTLEPLIEIWHYLKDDPNKLMDHYRKIIKKYEERPQEIYDKVLERFNKNPNGLDLVILSRTCYGGVVRFRKDGKMSTPKGPHDPISPDSFEKRVWNWRGHIQNTKFLNVPFKETMSAAEEADLIYCDPPYIDTQSILYGSQGFSFQRLIEKIEECKRKGAKIALSIDGKKKSGDRKVKIDIPEELFQSEIFIEGESSMLKRFQSGGEVMIDEDVEDRLLLTW